MYRMKLVNGKNKFGMGNLFFSLEQLEMEGIEKAKKFIKKKAYKAFKTVEIYFCYVENGVNKEKYIKSIQI